MISIDLHNIVVRMVRIDLPSCANNISLKKKKLLEGIICEKLMQIQNLCWPFFLSSLQIGLKNLKSDIVVHREWMILPQKGHYP